MMTTLFSFSNAILACPMCMSGADDNTAKAANMAIFVLFIILMCVLAAFLTFIGYLANRSRTAEIIVGADPSTSN